jgi:murein DD-endopeptidase MepM/ murein hydrolase activator NlpD
MIVISEIKIFFKRIKFFIRSIFIEEKQRYVSSKILNDININFKNLSPYYDMTVGKTIIMLIIMIIFLMFSLFFAYNDIRYNIIYNNEIIENKAMKIIISNPRDFLNNMDYKETSYKIKRNDTFIGILVDKVNVDYNTAYEIIKAVQKVYNLKNLRVGQIINFKFKKTAKTNEKDELENYTDLKGLVINSDDLLKRVVVEKQGDKYKSTIEDVKLNLLYNKYFVYIRNGLYVDAINAGIPADVVMTLMNYYSFDIDFQRDLRVGDTLEVVFEAFYTESGTKIKNGEILYSNLFVNKKKYELYRLIDKNNKFIGYFDYDGLSTEKSLMRTPINGARVSSGFNLRRKHPVLGYTKEHRAIDFAAPSGTPFYAAGSGKIIKVVSNCRQGNRMCGNGYGNYLQIKHGDNYTTGYAHASKIADNIREGVSVKQGDIIAYVGATGIATGPHLHYEVIYKGEKINPSKIKTIPSKRLKGEDLLYFVEQRDRINNLRATALNQNVNI